ncbi:MAG TPA: S-methyl-5-thioribose-1-phosphate isomerase [Myxococcota bacterium]|nr:S-methyl-5-thioribose-1-phosphate isomerase [Myxococcota bacterium]HOA12999.1 S-methyl-5-thioribose-1-phosphate isomerase [Myxococcota bacterium]HPV03223.1 S-methyl-5-thioribose-1-phosphate isomerase [Myxococcota bacterium]
MDIRPVFRDGLKLFMLDQRLLPHREVFLEYHDAAGVAGGISDMVVRGAPAIGIAAAYGIALEAFKAPDSELFQDIGRAAAILMASRPTAVNLAWAVNRMVRTAGEAGQMRPQAIRARLLAEADAILAEDIEMNRRIGSFGAALLPDRCRVMTHCNAGALATGGFGTALGVIRAARDAGKDISVISCETRPYLQGARLTCWELVRDGFDVTLITDNSAAWQMASGNVDCVIVGADRIAANGDTANKIGTLSHAIAAGRYGIPFYVAAPSSTLDASLPDGSGIPIEQRDPSEVVSFGGVRVAAEGVSVANPSFDVTPAGLISAIITDRGVFKPGPDGYRF